MKNIWLWLLVGFPIMTSAQLNSAYLTIKTDMDSGNVAEALSQSGYEDSTAKLTPFFKVNLEMGLLFPKTTGIEAYIGFSGRMDLNPGYYDEDRNVRQYSVDTKFEYVYLGVSLWNGIFESAFYSAPHKFQQYSYTTGVEHRNIIRWLRLSSQNGGDLTFSSDISFDWVVNRQIRDLYLADPDRIGTLDDIPYLWNVINRLSYLKVEHQLKFGLNDKIALTHSIDIFSRDMYYDHDPLSILYEIEFDFKLYDGLSAFVASSLQFNYLDDPYLTDANTGESVRRADFMDWRIQAGIAFRADIWEF